LTFLIADTFTAALARLQNEDQKLVKTTIFDLQVNPANPGHSMERLSRAKDSRFWSVRVSRDIRIIVHRSDSSLMVCYVDHHDDAYRWAEKRRVETHPRTGAVQMVEIRESIREVETFEQVVKQAPAPPLPALFSSLTIEELLSYGVPEDWADEVLSWTEEDLLGKGSSLPSEASEALLQLATGGRPSPQPVLPTGADPFTHPDSQRRFRVMDSLEELKEALEYPWDKWAVFLHPDQRRIVEADWNGPARVSGSAGTGKTVVALHRAVHLLRANPDARVLLTTFSPLLAKLLMNKVQRLLASDPRLGERIEAADLDTVGARLAQSSLGPIKLVDAETVQSWIIEARELTPCPQSDRFIFAEWSDVVDAWQVKTWEEYRDIRRLGRKTRLPESQRLVLWEIYERVLERLRQEGCLTLSAVFTNLAEAVKQRPRPPFDFVVVDEAQDLSIAQLKFLAAMGDGRSNSLFFAGDLGQRIFQQPFSWKSLGVDVRGRSKTLKVNYRTSHQIRSQADRLLGPVVSDVDGNEESRKGTVSVFNGPVPEVICAESEANEAASVSDWFKSLAAKSVNAEEMAVFVRSKAELDRAEDAVRLSGLNGVFVGTMHDAKGLEFRAVAVMACDDEVIPLQSRVAEVGDNADLEEVYTTERHLLYVAATRARDHLLLTSGSLPSEFLEDFSG